MTGFWWSWVAAGALGATPWLAVALLVERLGRNRLRPGLLHVVLVVGALELLIPVGVVAVVPGPGSAGLVAGGGRGFAPEWAGVWAAAAPMVWLVGCLGFAGFLLLGTMRLRGRLEEEGRSAGALEGSVRTVARVLGIRSPRALLWPGAPGPFVTGVLRPVVVVPPGLARSLPPERLRHLLLHELVHVRRGDLWWELAWAVVASLFWFHPLVHPLRARARALREARCDAEAARLAGPAPEDYRETLILVGRAVLAAPGGRCAAVASFARARELVWRARLLRRSRREDGRSRRRVGAGAVAGVAALGLLIGSPPGGRTAVDPAPGPDGIRSDFLQEPTDLEWARRQAQAALEAHRAGTGGSIQLRNAVLGLRNAARAPSTDTP